MDYTPLYFIGVGLIIAAIAIIGMRFVKPGRDLGD